MDQHGGRVCHALTSRAYSLLSAWSRQHCICDAQKYIGGKYQLPDETGVEHAAIDTDGKKQKHKKGKRLAVTSLLRSEPTAVSNAPGADATAADDAELTDESLGAEEAPTLAAVEPQGLRAVQHDPLYGAGAACAMNDKHSAFCNASAACRRLSLAT